MLQLILGIVVGIVTAFAVVFGVETVAHQLYPVAAGVDFNDTAQVAAFMKTMPLAGLGIIVLAWVAGAYAGSVVALLVGGRRRLAGIVPSALVLLATVVNLATFPHPAWMAIGGLAGIVAAAWLADRLFARKQA